MLYSILFAAVVAFTRNSRGTDPKNLWVFTIFGLQS